MHLCILVGPICVKYCIHHFFFIMAEWLNSKPITVMECDMLHLCHFLMQQGSVFHSDSHSCDLSIANRNIFLWLHYFNRIPGIQQGPLNVSKQLREKTCCSGWSFVETTPKLAWPLLDKVDDYTFNRSSNPPPHTSECVQMQIAIVPTSTKTAVLFLKSPPENVSVRQWALRFHGNQHARVHWLHCC